MTAPGPERFDLIVIGAGPAGASAATEADRAGLRVLLLDEQPAAGGQIYRPLPAEFSPREGRAPGPDLRAGAALRAALAGSGAEARFRRRVWHLARGFSVFALGPDGVERYAAPALLVAAGTHERVIAFPGWTLPGVIGLAGATVLLKSQQVLPGERVVVAGAGPLLGAVAAGILKGGGRVVACVDLASPAEWMRLAPAAGLRPDLWGQAAGWTAAFLRGRVPLYPRHAVVEARGPGRVAEVCIAPVGGDGAPRADAPVRVLRADSLCVGHGLVPATEMTRALGAEHLYRPDEGGWIARRDACLRTSVERLYVAGDGAGIAGAVPAALRGRLAALAAARDLGRLAEAEFARKAAPVRRRLARTAAFGAAVARLMALRPGLARTVSRDTLVCRCEDLTRAEIEDAIGEGAREINQLKSWTRCGMGPCQGRMCGETVASLMAARVGSREAVGQWTARPPFRPVDFEALTGDFTYDHLPFPPTAPA
ncbi:MAG: FAD-dependent oxidoreductase [Proteobacteria bacterium]|nr:FAD-dependent oxidoreductase [Pseudomonadota bacterium]